MGVITLRACCYFSWYFYCWILFNEIALSGSFYCLQYYNVVSEGNRYVWLLKYKTSALCSYIFRMRWMMFWLGWLLIGPVIFSLIKYCFVLKSRGWITIIVQNKICQSRVWCTNICMMVVDYLSDSVVKTGYKTLTVFSCVCLLEKVVREIWDNIMVLLHWLKRFEKFGVLIFQKRSMFDCPNLIYLFDIRNVWTSCCSCLKFEIRGCILWN